MSKMLRSKNRKLILIGTCFIFAVIIGTFSYYFNEPLFSYNYIEDDFENKVPGLFPIGWLSVVDPFNVRVYNDDGNNVMEVRDTDPDGVTEIVRRFKKTSEGIIKCRVKPLDVNSGFTIHIPQTDKEYNPYDDIIIYFYKGEVYVIGEDNILNLENVDPSWLDQLVLLDDTGSFIIDEWGLEDYESVYSYNTNEWYEVTINFNRDTFILLINGKQIGSFDYPKYNPQYFASLYFWTSISLSDFRFYVDDVKITLTQSTDYIHPANVIFLSIVSFSFIIIIFRVYKMKAKQKKRN